MGKTDPQLTDSQADAIMALLRTLRAKLGSDQKVADAIGSNQPNVSRWRRYRPSRDAAEKLAEAGFLDLSEFERGDPSQAVGRPLRIPRSAVAELREISQRLAELVERVARENE